LAAVLLLAACGTPERAATSPAARELVRDRATTTVPRRATTSAPTTTTTASGPTRRARFTCDGTPPPRVRDTGTDHVEIYRSLDAYRTWLAEHHPDPTLIDRVWLPETSIHEDWRGHLADLQRHRVCWVEPGYRSEVRVASVLPNKVTLLVDAYIPVVELVDGTGTVVDRVTEARRASHIVMMRRVGGRWRIAMAEPRLTDDTEVHL
jgi:hypothetical protein